MIVRMWEARVLPGRLDDAVSWLVGSAAPGALAAGAVAAEAFRARGGEERAVLITRWAVEPTWVVPDPPAPLWARAHSWDFEPAT